MNEVSCYCQFMSVKVERSPCEVYVSLYSFVGFQRPARTFAVCKAYVAAVVNKLTNCYCGLEYYSLIGIVLYFKDIEAGFGSVKRNRLQTFAAENNFMVSTWHKIIRIACMLLSKITLDFYCSVCKTAVIVI